MKISDVANKNAAMKIAAIAALLASLAGAVHASEIVALGASNTLGRGRGPGHGGVDRNQAYPAQLQAMLQRQGCKVRVANAGVAGDTTSGMLARLPLVITKQTKLVILQPGNNDADGNRSANIAQIEQTLASRGIGMVTLDRPGQIARGYQLSDGLHFSAEGHTAFATYLLPKVTGMRICG